ncbi:MAG: ABC transporter ATP-binding protein [Lachnospiraceae bacterium]|nr:ABC transporter ATP-binding protein [Lachnospiraceae bacterium]
MNAIQISNLTKYYGKSRGIIDLSLTVQEGEFFGFIGPNGAGKSTTIRTLLGLISPDSGSARILGMDIRNDREAVLSKVGYLPSEAIFYSGTKVKDILKLSADLRKKDCSREAAVLCDRLQLNLTRRVSELSFGNRKKVAIVCALQHTPDLLILDEPTSGLDPLMQHEFFAILEERNRQGTAIFLSSHILSEIQHNCTRAAIIREGRIIACDNVEALSKTNAKRVTVQGNVSVPPSEFIRNLEESNGTTSFLYSGDIKQLLKTLSEGEITDLSISEPDLEEIFMHYYESSQDKKGTETL